MSGEALTWVVAQNIPSAPQKLIMVMLARRMNNHTGECFPGQGKLAEDCSMSERALRNHLPELERGGFIRRRMRFHESGVRKTDAYFFPGFQEWLENQADSAKEYGERARKSTSGANLPVVQNGTSGANLPVAEKRETTGANLPLKNLKKNTKDNKKPAHAREEDAIRTDAPKTWSKRDPMGLNPWQAEHHDDVRFDDDLRIVVHNGFEAELRALLMDSGLDLRRTLDEAAKYVQRSAPPAELKIQVRSQVTRLVREAKERAEARAARAVKLKAEATAAELGPTQTRAQRIRAMVEERKAQRQKEVTAI